MKMKKTTLTQSLVAARQSGQKYKFYIKFKRQIT